MQARLRTVTVCTPSRRWRLSTRRERVELAPIGRRRHVGQAENAVIKVVVAERNVERSAEARRVDAALRRELRAEPGDEGNPLLRLGRELVRQAVQEDAELAERLAVIAHVDERRRVVGAASL